MIRNIGIKIGDGEVLDTYDGYGLIYLKSDNRTEAPVKKRDTTSYAEEAGEHIDPRTVQDAFDHTITFLIECPNKALVNANTVIGKFNSLLYAERSDSDIRVYKQVTVFDSYKRVKIVGLPEPIAEPKELYRRQDGSIMDCAVVEFKLRCNNPGACDFSMPDYKYFTLESGSPILLENGGLILLEKNTEYGR